MSEINITNEILIDELQKRFKKYQDTLRELKKVNDDLNEVNEKLAESESLKSHFLSNIANEIINPFTAIIGSSQTIMNADIEDFEMIKRMAQGIYNEASYLDFQLKNIFAAAEIEAGEAAPMLSKMNIVETACEIKERYVNTAKDKNITIKFENKTGDEELFIISDIEKISLMIANLINNAIKYGDDNSEVNVYIENENEQVTISVKNYGEIIPSEKIKTLFDRFNRAKNNINSIERGSGLGLSIVNYYAELLEAELNFESKPEKGTIFSLTFKTNDLDEIDSFSMDDNQIFFEDIETF